MKIDKIQKLGILAFIILSSTNAHRHKGIRRGGSPLRVYQGENATHDEYPYVTVLVMKLTVFDQVSPGVLNSRIITARVCTCSLISPDWVLLAAHCLRDIKAYGISFFKVFYGDLTIQPNQTEFQTNIRKYIAHFNYVEYLDSGLFKNDIALLLIDPIKSLRVAKISAIDYKSLTGLPVKYLGAGGTYSLSNLLNNEQKLINEVDQKDQTRPVQSAEAVVVTCDLKTFLYPAICIYNRCSKSTQTAMPGDSGGPLLYKGKIIGVASMTGPGAISHVPIFKKDIRFSCTVYTAVSPYLEWIKRVISEEGNCSTTTNTSGANIRKI